MVKQLKVLMPSCLHKLRISDQFAEHLGACARGTGMPHPKVFVVSSFGKIFHVDIGRDGKGAFLGYGWPEFVKASGFGLGWFLVLQHEGRGVLTVKAFDLTWCLKELGGFPPSTEPRSNIYASSRKPQFIMVLFPSFMDKMVCNLPATLFSYQSMAELPNQSWAGQYEGISQYFFSCGSVYFNPTLY
ncbi:putative B3 domain-containing protein Os04g0347400 isoform X2 [Triticum aestivum]|uniref:putative B3 domain-containing protein Os04g0347400 isoform X2 n=1 Tax=Triticum aestivum TaxID=4565 RepID=UPI001D001BA6|nr:putative B3 domain-containing protein Os04g0347400 isoform X2 [Triticum aestivum]